jgi:hypothetical protein
MESAARTNGSRLGSAAGALILAIALGGCSLWPPAPGTVKPAGVAAAEQPQLVLSANHIYRLIVGPRWADSPSRLLVVYARVQNAGDQSIAFRPEEMRLQLADGESGRVFDRARAAELLRRTNFGEAEPPTGGTRMVWSEAALDEQVLHSLIDATNLSPGQVMEGFLIVDVGRPVASLEGAALEVVGTRSGDMAPVRDTYRFVKPSVVSAAQ